MRFAVILPAAGRSRRFTSSSTEDSFVGGTAKKVYVTLAGRPVWTYAAERFAERTDVARILMVIAAEDRELFERQRAQRADLATNPEIWRRIEVVIGGDERVDSIRNAISRLGTTPTEGSTPELGWVAIHDAARPCVTTPLIDRVFDAAKRTGAAIPAVPVVATLKRTGGVPGTVGTDLEWCGETVSRQELREAQTPQVFDWQQLAKLYTTWDRLFATGQIPTDDAQLFERSGIPVAMVRGSSWNLKITTPEDLRLAEAILRMGPPSTDA